MKIDINNYKKLITQLINGCENYVYIYNKNELVCTCYSKDIKNITIIDLINCKKIHIFIGRCIINCDEIRF